MFRNYDVGSKATQDKHSNGQKVHGTEAQKDRCQTAHSPGGFLSTCILVLARNNVLDTWGTEITFKPINIYPKNKLRI